MALPEDPCTELKSILVDNWDPTNTDNVTPTIKISTEGGYNVRWNYQGRGAGHGDMIFLYSLPGNETPVGLGYTHVHYTRVVSINLGTVYSRARFTKLFNEVRRIIHLKRKGVNYDECIFLRDSDQSNKKTGLHKSIIDVELRMWAETA